MRGDLVEWVTPHWGYPSGHVRPMGSSSVDAVSVDQDRSQSVTARDGVAAVTAVLRETGRADVPFGSESTAEEAAFLAALGELLNEVSVQFAARRLPAGAALTDARDEVAALQHRLENADTSCGCGHSPRQHRTSGCNWENDLGTEHCRCTALISGLAPVQLRSYVAPSRSETAF